MDRSIGSRTQGGAAQPTINRRTSPNLDDGPHHSHRDHNRQTPPPPQLRREPIRQIIRPAPDSSPETINLSDDDDEDDDDDDSVQFLDEIPRRNEPDEEQLHHEQVHLEQDDERNVPDVDYIDHNEDMDNAIHEVNDEDKDEVISEEDAKGEQGELPDSIYNDDAASMDFEKEIGHMNAPEEEKRGNQNPIEDHDEIEMDTNEGSIVVPTGRGEESLQESFSAFVVNAHVTNGIEAKDKTNDDKDKTDDDNTPQATTTSKNKKRTRKKKKKKNKKKKSALTYKAGTSGNIQYKMSEVFREDSHSGAIYCVTFNNVSAEKNGQELMATCGDKVATVYLRRNGELIPHSTYRDDADVYHTCCWSVDQRTQRQILIFAGHRGHIHMVDVGLQVYIKTYRSHALAVNDLKVAPLDPTYLLSASNDQSIRLWNTWNDVLVAKFGGADGHNGEVLSIDFHPHEWYFVSCGVDRSIRVWSLARGTILEAMDEAKLIQPGSPKKYQFRTRHEQVPAFATRQIHENIIDCVAWIKDWIITRSSMEEIAIFRPGKRLTTQTTQLRHHFKSLKYNSSDTSTDTEIWRGMMAKDREEERDGRRKNGEEVTTTDSSSGSEDEIIDFKLPPLYEVDRIRLSNMSCWFLRFQMDKRRSVLGVGNMIGQLLLWDLTLKDAFDVPPIVIPAHPYTRNNIVRQVAFNRDGSRMAAVTDKCMVIVYELTRITPPGDANPIGETVEQPVLDPMVCGEVDVTGKPVKKMWLHPDFIPEHFTQEDIDRVFWGRAYDLSHRNKYFMGMGGEKQVLHHKPIARSSKNRPETKKQTEEQKQKPKPEPTKKYSTRRNRADVGSDSSCDESESSDESNDSAKSRNTASSAVEPISSAEPKSLKEKSPSVGPSSSGEPNPSADQIQLQMPGTSGENLISPSTSTETKKQKDAPIQMKHRHRKGEKERKALEEQQRKQRERDDKLKQKRQLEQQKQNETALLTEQHIKYQQELAEMFEEQEREDQLVKQQEQIEAEKNDVSITEGDTEPTNSALESNDGVPSPSSETNEGTNQIPEESDDPMDVDGDREEEVIEIVESPEVDILDDDDDEGVQQEVEDEDDDIQEIPIPTPEPNANMVQDPAEIERLEQEIEQKKQELERKMQEIEKNDQELKQKEQEKKEKQERERARQEQELKMKKQSEALTQMKRKHRKEEKERKALEEQQRKQRENDEKLKEKQRKQQLEQQKQNETDLLTEQHIKYQQELAEMFEEQEREDQLSKQQQEQIEAEKERQRQIKAQMEQQRQIEAQMEQQRQIEAQMEQQRQIEAQMEQQRQIEAQMEQQRQIEAQMEQQRQIEAEKKRKEQIEAEKERQRQIEAQKERQRQIDAQKERQRQIEAQKEQQRQIEAQKKQQEQIEAQMKQQQQIEQLIQGPNIEQLPKGNEQIKRENIK